MAREDIEKYLEYLGSLNPYPQDLFVFNAPWKTYIVQNIIAYDNNTLLQEFVDYSNHDDSEIDRFTYWALHAELHARLREVGFLK